MITATEKITSFDQLRAWQEGHWFVLDIYRITKDFPTDERFGLTSQIRRVAVSITSNIAEGFSRFSLKEKNQFYSISLGSLHEVQNQILIARDLHFISPATFLSLMEHATSESRLINGLMKTSKNFARNT